MATTYMTLKEALKELSDLPTPDAIADHLVSLEILGARKSGTRCALAKFFELRTGKYVAVGMGDMYNQVWTVGTLRGLTIAGGYSIDGTEEYHLPAHLIRFASEFDCGMHPKLDSGSEFLGSEL